jgi:hypothetical protein
MTQIRTSLHGKLAGIGPNDELIVPGGLVLGEHGKQRRVGGPSTVELFDDFTAGLNTGAWLATEGTDSATSVAAIAGINGGALRLTTGDAGTGYAADAEQITQNQLMWVAANGNLVFETRVKLSAITTCYAFFGFTDTVAAALEQPIKSATGTTFTTNASDAVGFMFDTGMTSANWWLTGVAADVDATMQDSGFAPVADTYETLRIELDASGNAVFYRNGREVGTRMATAVTAATLLTPVMTASKLSVAASMTVDIDYVHTSMTRV